VLGVVRSPNSNGSEISHMNRTLQKLGLPALYIEEDEHQDESELWVIQICEYLGCPPSEIHDTIRAKLDTIEAYNPTQQTEAMLDLINPKICDPKLFKGLEVVDYTASLVENVSLKLQVLRHDLDDEIMESARMTL
jgi:hypothetical protein